MIGSGALSGLKMNDFSEPFLVVLSIRLLHLKEVEN